MANIVNLSWYTWKPNKTVMLTFSKVDNFILSYSSVIHLISGNDRLTTKKKEGGGFIGEKLSQHFMKKISWPERCKTINNLAFNNKIGKIWRKIIDCSWTKSYSCCTWKKNHLAWGWGYSTLPLKVKCSIVLFFYIFEIILKLIVQPHERVDSLNFSNYCLV